MGWGIAVTTFGAALFVAIHNRILDWCDAQKGIR